MGMTDRLAGGPDEGREQLADCSAYWIGCKMVNEKCEKGVGNVRTNRDDHGCGSAALEVEPFFRIYGTKNLEGGLGGSREYLWVEENKWN